MRGDLLRGPGRKPDEDVGPGAARARYAAPPAHAHAADRAARESERQELAARVRGVEGLDLAGGCAYNYACVYMDSISWASPRKPLPMVRENSCSMPPRPSSRRTGSSSWLSA